jgi:electron transfer flavoprotein beta subunit
MKFTVCIKQVPDVNAPLQIKEGELIQDADRMILNAYDASAVEEALVMKEEHGGEVEVVLVGPAKAKETIRKALAMGADKAVHIKLDEDKTYDSATYAEILSTFLKDHEFDILAAGKQSQDTDSGLAGGMMAQHMDLPYASNAVGLKVEDGKLVVKRQGDAGQEMIALPTPCLVTCSNDMNEPRIPSLKGIMQSKRKPIEEVTLSDLDIDEASLDPNTKVLSYEEKPEREAGKKFEGEPDELAQQVAKLLSEEAGVI